MTSERTWTGVVHQTAPGHVTIDVPGLARAIVEDNGAVTIHASDDADQADLDSLRARPVTEAQALLAGQFALRAAAVAGRASASAPARSGPSSAAVSPGHGETSYRPSLRHASNVITARP